VLQVISRSAGELQPVFQAMLENVTRVCGAKFGTLFRYEGGLFHPAALNNVPSAFADFLAGQGSFAPVPRRVDDRAPSGAVQANACGSGLTPTARNLGSGDPIWIKIHRTLRRSTAKNTPISAG
jgi:hypothetical protein